MSQDTKRKKEKVRFEEETVWMSLEDFQKGKAKDLHDVKNLRIEQDFNLSKPESMKYFKGNKLVMPLEGYLEEEEIQANSTRKLKNLDELQKIQFKKVIDGLDLWNNELKNKKRVEAMNEQYQICLEFPDFQSQSKKKLLDPEINMNLLNSIINQPEESMKKPLINIDNNIIQKKHKNDDKDDLSMKSIDLIEEDISESQIQLKKQKENEKRNSIIMNFPKSLSQIPTRPVTLTSLKLKNINDFKHLPVSRYVIDSDNKVVMKTDAQLQAEQNNIVINEIFKNKLVKVLEKEKPQTKKEYQEIVNNQTALFKKDILANFKSLHYLNRSESGAVAKSLRDPSHPKYGTIEYKKLYNELFEDKLIKRNVKLEKEQQQLLQQRKYLDEKERNLFEAFQKYLQNYRTNKETINKLRVLLNINSQKKKQKNDELKIVAEEYDKRARKMESENVSSLLKQIEGKKYKKPTYVQSNPYNDQIDLIQEKKLDAIADVKRQLSELDEELRQIQEEVDQAQKDYQNSKEKKNEIKFLLKQHFLKQLSKEINEKSPKSLVSIVVKLMNIKEKITFNIFPDYLEEKSIEYLIKMSNLEIEKNEKMALIKSMQNSQRFHNLQQNYQQKMTQFQSSGKKQRNNSSITALSSSSTINPIQNNNSNIGSTNKLSLVKKPVLIYDKHINENQIVFQAEDQFNFNSQSSLQKQQIDNQFKEIKVAEEQYKNLLIQIEETKQAEFERLSLKYLKSNNDCKNIFYALFGYQDGEKFLYEFERRKIKIEHLINSNKTFRFSNHIGQQPNIKAKSNLLNSQSQTPRSISQTESTANTNNNSNNTSSQGFFQNRKLSTYDSSSISVPYQLADKYMPTKNRSKNFSLTEQVLDSAKNGQQNSLRQSAFIQLKKSIDQQDNIDFQDAFQLFSPRIAPSIKKKLLQMSLQQENITPSSGMRSPQSPNSNLGQNLGSRNSEKKKVGFYDSFKDQISDSKNNSSLGSNFQKSFSQYQNSQQSRQKAPFLSNFFNKEDRTPLSNLQSPISSGVKPFSFSSPLISDMKVSQFTESDFQRNNYTQINAKFPVKVSNFLDDKSQLKKEE